MTDFSIGSILGRSFSIFGKNIVSFILLGVLLNIPSLYFVHEQIGLLESLDASGGTNPILQRLITMFTGQLLVGTLTYGTVMELRGMHASVGKCVQVGLVRALPAMLVALLVGIAVGVGTLLLVVPGIIVYTILYVAIPVAIIERPGIMASLSRSSELTRGYRGKIFGLAVILTGSVMILIVIFVLKFDGMIADDLDSYGTFMYALTGLSIFMAIISAVVASVVYHDLRAIKDGVNIDELAAVFE